MFTVPLPGTCANQATGSVVAAMPVIARRRMGSKTGAALKALCEDCGKVSRNYGTLKEKKVRWCGRCAKAHKGIVLPVRKPKQLDVSMTIAVSFSPLNGCGPTNC